jgi:hypothetical protein
MAKEIRTSIFEFLNRLLMKRLILLITLFVCILPIISNGQDSSFQLKNYKYRTPGFKALQLNINASGSFYDATMVNQGDIIGNNINSNSGINYFRIISKEKRQHISTILFNPVFNFTKHANGTITERNRQLILDAEWNRIDRFFNKRNFFFEVGNELGALSSSQKTGSQFIDTKTKSNSVSNMLILGVGKGRLENVQDAQMAMFIMNDLQKMGLLDRVPDASTQYELAALITDINNRRVFDDRKRLIYELTRIDSFLQSKQLITAPSIAYFTTVNDNWVFAFNPGRLSGTRIYAQLKPGISLNVSAINQSDTNVFTYKSDSKRVEYFYEPEIGIERHKPIKLQWQRVASAAIRFRQTFKRVNTKTESASGSGEFEMFETYPQLLFNSFYGFGYFPTTRTVVNGGLSFDAVYGRQNIGTGRPTYFKLAPGLRLSANYFINFRTRLFLDAAINYSYTEMSDLPPVSFTYEKNVVTGNFIFGFSHVIF